MQYSTLNVTEEEKRKEEKTIEQYWHISINKNGQDTFLWCCRLHVLLLSTGDLLGIFGGESATSASSTANTAQGNLVNTNMNIIGAPAANSPMNMSGDLSGLNMNGNMNSSGRNRHGSLI